MDNAQLATKAQEYIDRYNSQVAALFGVPPITVSTAFRNLGGASVGGLVGMVYIDPSKWDPRNLGAIIFELTRSYGVPIDNKANWAIADAVRYLIAGDKANAGDPNWALDKKASMLVDAYKQNPNVFSVASQQLQDGTFTDIQGVVNAANAITTGTSETINSSGAETATTTGQWQFNGTPGDLGAMQDPKNWSWVGPGQPTTPNPSTIFSGSAGGVANPAVRAAAFQQILMNWGIPMDARMKNLVNQAANAGWSTNQLMQKLYTTSAFHEAFPGIFSPNGTLKMSPAQYLANQRSYQSYAQVYGVNLNDKQMGFLFQNDVSPQEFRVRAQALTTLRTNNQYFDAFNQQLKQMGMQPLSRSEQFRFVMGEGNQEWYDIWRQASTRYSAEQAGLSFGHAAKAYTNLGQGIIKRVSGLGLSQSQMQQGFAQLAKDLQTILPMSRIQKFGLSKQDLVELEFGGPRQAAIAAKVQQVLANEKAFLGNQVNLSSQTGQLGTTARDSTQQPFALGP